MVPTAGTAHLYNVHRELLCCFRKPSELVRGSGRSRNLTELVAEHPGHERQLFLAANGADDVAAPAVELRGSE